MKFCVRVFASRKEVFWKLTIYSRIRIRYIRAYNLNISSFLSTLVTYSNLIIPKYLSSKSGFQSLSMVEQMEFEMRFNNFYNALRNRDTDLAMSILRKLDLQTIHRHFKKPALHMSAACGNQALTEHLIKAGYKLDAKDIHGNTPLLLAVRFNHYEVVKYLLGAGADFLIANDYGRSSLFYAASNEKIMDMVKLAVKGNKAKRLVFMKQLMDANYYQYLIREWAHRFSVATSDIRPLAGAAMVEDVGQLRLNLMYGAEPMRLNRSNSNVRGLHYPTEFLLRHLAILEAEGVHMDRCYFEEVRKCPDVVLYYEQCQKELQGLMVARLFGDATLFHVLVDNRQFALYASSECLVRAFRSVNVAKDFPCYSRDLTRRFEEWAVRAKLTRVAAVFLGCSLPYFDSDHLVVFRILSHLRTSELRMLCKPHKH